MREMLLVWSDFIFLSGVLAVWFTRPSSGKDAEWRIYEQHVHELNLRPERTPEWERGIERKLRRQRVLGVLMCLVALAIILVVHRVLD